MNISHCSDCGEDRPLAEFTIRKSGRLAGKPLSYCKTHNAARARAHYAANREAELAKDKAEREHLRMTVLDHYGHACACCGSPDDLTIDHINGDGRQQRAELWGYQNVALPFYRWVIDHGFPDDLQTMCRRCNTSKRDGQMCRLNHELAA